MISRHGGAAPSLSLSRWFENRNFRTFGFQQAGEVQQKGTRPRESGFEMVDTSHNATDDSPKVGPEYLYNIDGGSWLITTSPVVSVQPVSARPIESPDR